LKIETGLYQYDYTSSTTLYGRYLGTWTSSDTVIGGEPQAFIVLPKNPPVTVGEMRARLELASTNQDDEIATLILEAIPIVESVADGPILPVTAPRTFDGGREGILLPLTTGAITTVTENGVTLAAGTDYHFDSDTGILRRGSSAAYTRLWCPGYGNVVVTYTAGSAYPTPNVSLAIKECVKVLWQQSHGGRGSFQEGTLPPVASAGVSDALVRRLRMTLGKRAGWGI
jgi:hypothetical protein